MKFFAKIHEGKNMLKNNGWKRLDFKVTNEIGDPEYLSINESLQRFIYVSGVFPSWITKDFIDSELSKDEESRTVFQINGEYNEKFRSIDLKSIHQEISYQEIVRKSPEWKAIFFKEALLDKETIKNLISDNSILTNILFGTKYDRAMTLHKECEMNLERARLAITDIDENKNKYAEVANGQEKTVVFNEKLSKAGLKYHLPQKVAEEVIKTFPDDKTQKEFIGSMKKNLYDALSNLDSVESQKMIDKIYFQDKNHKATDKVRVRYMILRFIKEYEEINNLRYMPFDQLKYRIDHNDSLLDFPQGLRPSIKKALKIAVSDLSDDNQIKIIQDIKKEKLYVLLQDEYLFDRNLIEEIEELSKTKINKLSKTEIDKGIKESEKAQGFKFSDEQKEVISDVLNSPISTINGFAGTGKSTILRAIDTIFGNKYGEDSIIQCAFTGRAADSLYKSSGHEAKTAHSSLLIQGDDELDKFFKRYSNILPTEEGYDLFLDDLLDRLNKSIGHLPEKGEGMIVIDEYPTLDIAIFCCLLHVAFHMKYRLVLIGDSEQLPAIRLSSDEIINDHPSINHHELKTVKRQDDSSMIYHDSLEVRKGKIPELFNDGLHKNDLTYHKEGKAINDIVKNYVLDAKEHGIKDTVILSPFNEDVHRLNQQIHERLTKQHKNQEGFMIGPKDDQTEVFAGEYIINTKNQYSKVPLKDDPKKISLYNGNIGMISRIERINNTKTMYVNFKGFGTVVFNEKDQLHQFLELAYAITIHRSQGSTIKNVIVAIQNHPQKQQILSKQLLYTAMTRASDKMDMYIDDETMKTCINHTVNDHKKTLINLLIDKDNYRILK